MSVSGNNLIVNATEVHFVQQPYNQQHKLQDFHLMYYKSSYFCVMLTTVETHCFVTKLFRLFKFFLVCGTPKCLTCVTPCSRFLLEGNSRVSWPYSPKEEKKPLVSSLPLFESTLILYSYRQNKRWKFFTLCDGSVTSLVKV